MACHLQCNEDEGFCHQIQHEELQYPVDDQECSNNEIRPSNELLEVTSYSQDDPTIEQRKYPIGQIQRFS